MSLASTSRSVSPEPASGRTDSAYYDMLPDVERSFTQKRGRSHYPYVFRRVFHCGHPDEVIEVTQLLNGDRLKHNLISKREYDEQTSNQTYSLERCHRCAIQHGKLHGDLHLNRGSKQLRQERTYQGERMPLDQPRPEPQNGFDRALARFQQDGKDDQETRRHARMFEEEFDQYPFVHGPNGSTYKKAQRRRSSFSKAQDAPQASATEDNELNLRGGRTLMCKPVVKDKALKRHSQQEHVVKHDGFRNSVAREEQRPNQIERRVTVSQVLEDIRTFEDELHSVHTVCQSRFSSDSSLALSSDSATEDAAKVWWKVKRRHSASHYAPTKVWRRLSLTGLRARTIKHGRSGSESHFDGPGAENEEASVQTNRPIRTAPVAPDHILYAMRHPSTHQSIAHKQYPSASTSVRHSYSTIAPTRVSSESSVPSLDIHKPLPPMPISLNSHHARALRSNSAGAP